MQNIELANKWKDNSCSWIGRFNIVEMSVLPKLICGFNEISINISEDFFVETDKLVL